MARAAPDLGLRAIMRAHLPEFHWVTIETGLTESGVPDAEFCMRGWQGWVECKGTAGWAVALNPAQVGWLLRRVRQGGRAFVAVRRRRAEGPRTQACDELWMLNAAHSPAIRRTGLRCSEAVLGHWAGGPSRWDWSAVGRLLAPGG